MNVYLIRTDDEFADDPLTLEVCGVMDEVRAYVKRHPAAVRQRFYVELRDMPTDKATLLTLLRDRLVHTSDFPANVGALLRSWSVTPRGALKEDIENAQ